jgi:hypothetical protein
VFLSDTVLPWVTKRSFLSFRASADVSTPTADTAGALVPNLTVPNFTICATGCVCVCSGIYIFIYICIYTYNVHTIYMHIYICIYTYSVHASKRAHVVVGGIACSVVNGEERERVRLHVCTRVRMTTHGVRVAG